MKDIDTIIGLYFQYMSFCMVYQKLDSKRFVDAFHTVMSQLDITKYYIHIVNIETQYTHKHIFDFNHHIQNLCLTKQQPYNEFVVELFEFQEHKTALRILFHHSLVDGERCAHIFQDIAKTYNDSSSSFSAVTHSKNVLLDTLTSFFTAIDAITLSPRMYMFHRLTEHIPEFLIERSFIEHIRKHIPHKYSKYVIMTRLSFYILCQTDR